MIRATIVLVIAHLIIPRLRRQSAAERHAMWAASLATAALLPLLVLVVPSWQPEWARSLVDALPAALARIEPAATGYGDIIVRATGVESSGWTVSAIAPLWIFGSVVALLVLGLEAVKLRRLISSARLVTDSRTLEIAVNVARSLESPTPQLLSSERVAIPIAWGTRRAHILLPQAAGDWPDERLWAVLAHEMGHMRRGDWTTHLLAELVCAIYWFHPLFWVGRNRLGRESEQAADDIVLGLGANGADYALHLLEIVRAAGRTTTRLASTVAMARRSDLERRVAALLSGFVNRSRMTRGHLIAIAAVAIVVALPLAAMPARGPSISIELRTTNLAPLVEGASAAAGRASETVAPLQVRVLEEPLIAGQGTPPEIESYTTPPLYSDDARRQGIEGVVTARVHVNTSGRLSQVRVVKGLGFGLDQNALVALRQWRFRPGTRGGAPAATDVEIDIEFTLRNETINALIANDMATLVGPGITPPKAVRVVQLKAGPAGVRGIVALDVVLLEDGTPRIVRILKSLTPEADETAVRAFEQWRFSPAVKNGQPVKVRMNAEVNFHG